MEYKNPYDMVGGAMVRGWLISWLVLLTCKSGFIPLYLT